MKDIQYVNMIILSSLYQLFDCVVRWVGGKRQLQLDLQLVDQAVCQVASVDLNFVYANFG